MTNNTSLRVEALLTMLATYNPRKIADKDMKALRASIREFGIVEPVVVNSRTNTVVGGHQRIRAADAEGVDEMPVIMVDLDIDSEKRLNLALNKISGTWDGELLESLLCELSESGADMSPTGFSEDEIYKLLNDGVPKDLDGNPQLGGAVFSVVVVCENEEHQADLIHRFEKEGLQCSALIS